MSEGGLLSRIVPMLLVIALVVTAFMLALSDYDEKFDINVSSEYNNTYNYSNKLMEDARALQGDVESQSSFSVAVDTLTNIVWRVPRLVINSFGYIGRIVGNSATAIGIPGEYGPMVGNILISIIVVTLIFAFASVFARRPI